MNLNNNFMSEKKLVDQFYGLGPNSNIIQNVLQQPKSGNNRFSRDSV